MNLAGTKTERRKAQIGNKMARKRKRKRKIVRGCEFAIKSWK